MKAHLNVCAHRVKKKWTQDIRTVIGRDGGGGDGRGYVPDALTSDDDDDDDHEEGGYNGYADIKEARKKESGGDDDDEDDGDGGDFGSFDPDEYDVPIGS